ncbi:bro-6 [Spodoptera litura granulovirus]|uniref:Bro-6 n=1 Tax=Spodoptera litura granulovirus TaxID=359919 RepID=A5IZW7_9BBAC|nr:bro-6 [Spodoptera litura granulovirus]ABQ52058.1 bro-6 [Spodoptera litura granulovirus]
MTLVKKSCNIGGIVGEVYIVEVEKDKFMYGGHGIAEFLGYKNTRDAIQKHVKPQWKTTWESVANRDSFVTSSQPVNLPVNWHPHTVFISEAGVYALIMRSKLPAAEEFQRWLFEEVLPELRKTGKYNIQDQQASSGTDIIANVAEMKIKLLEQRLDHQSVVAKYDAQVAQLNQIIAMNETTISELRRNYEQQISEFKERDYKAQLRMKDLANAANMTMTQFAVNAMLARDNIQENQQLRQTLTSVSDRIVPELKEQPHKEEYITGYERVVNGKRRIRMCRSQLNVIDQHDKVIRRYRDNPIGTRKRLPKSYSWLRDCTKFLQLKCSNPVAVWLKVRTEQPYMFYGLRYTNRPRTEIEVLDESELREKYRRDVEMCERNKMIDSKAIEEFKSLQLIDEDDCVKRCLTPSLEAKERVNTIVAGIMEDMSRNLIPETPTRTHDNAEHVYSPQQVVETMNNCQNYFVEKLFINCNTQPSLALECKPDDK